MLVGHMISTVDKAVAELRAASEKPVNLFSVVQRLALDIAAHTMFSLELAQNGPALRQLRLCGMARDWAGRACST